MYHVGRDDGGTQGEEMLGQRSEGLGGKGEMGRQGRDTEEGAGALNICFGSKNLFPH